MVWTQASWLFLRRWGEKELKRADVAWGRKLAGGAEGFGVKPCYHVLAVPLSLSLCSDAQNRKNKMLEWKEKFRQLLQMLVVLISVMGVNVF